MPRTAVHMYRRHSGEVPILDWLDKLAKQQPKAHVACLQRILQLEQLGYELRRPAADLLEDGIYELRAKARNVHYRILYFFCGKNAVCLSHGITKEGKVPSEEIKLARERRKQVEREPVKYLVPRQ